MNSKNYKIWLVSGFAAALLIGIVIGLFTASFYSVQRYDTIAAIAGKVSAVSEAAEEAVVQAIKTPELSDIKAGAGILKNYGYNEDIIADIGKLRLMIFSIVIFLIIYFITAIFVYLLLRKNRKKILFLTECLSLVNSGNYPLLSMQPDDDFSSLEDELYKTITELRQTKENAVQAKISLADNMADIAHQLKTPLTSISLMTELLADSEVIYEQRQYIEKVQYQVNKLQKLVSALLTLSRLDAGTLLMDRQKIDVFTLISSAVDSINEIASSKNQTIIFEEKKDVIFFGDFYWSTEALANIIKNCSEHTPENGSIAISYQQNPIYAEIIIEDNGEGLLKEDLPHIFTRFYRGKNAGKDSIGIGLALSKAIIEKQNGIIRAENRLQGGAVFTVKFYYN